MAITLEMPATDLDNNTTPPFTSDDPATNPTQSTANLAVDLLERGEAEGGHADEAMGTLEALTHDDIQPVGAESNGKPEKKKRTRKPKTDTAPIELKAAPAPAGDQLKSPTPELSARMADIKTSPVTRKFQISKVEAEYIEVSLTLNANEEIIESAKAEVKRLSERQRALALELRHLRNDDQWQPELPLADPSTAASPSPPVPTTTPGSTGQATTHAGEPVPATAVAAPVDLSSKINPDAWRSVLVDDLGLPPSITSKLLESCIDNLGQLEDLRIAVSKHEAKWPKGFGLAKVTLIEDALKKRISQSAVSLAEPLGESATLPTPNAPPAAVFEGAWEDLTAEEQQSFISARAVEINDNSPSCLDRKHADSDRFWSAGYKDFEAGEQLADCIYVPGVEQDDYIRGYLAAKAVEDYPTAKGKEPAATSPSPAQTPPPQSLLGDIDDI